MSTNPISVNQFKLEGQPINYYYFEGISHRLIMNFSVPDAELILTPQNNMIGPDKSYNQTFVKVGTAFTNLLVTHDQENKTITIIDQTNSKDVLHFNYLNYFKYNINHLT